MSGPAPTPPAHGPTPAAVPGPDCDPSARQLPVAPGRVPDADPSQPPSTVPHAICEPPACEPPACEPPSAITSTHGVAAQGFHMNHEPKVGMSFQTEKEAYEFYSSHARNVGFSFRKSHSKSRADGTLCSKYYVCSNEGQPVVSMAKPGRKQRPSTRSDCKARIQFTISREGVWTVQKALLEHNHLLASLDMPHMLRSQRRLAESDRRILDQMWKEGITAADIQRVLQQWSGGGENVHLLKKGSESQYLEPNYAQSLLEYLKNKQRDNPSFFYAVQLNDDGRIANFFWTDGQAIVDYTCFGDAVSFDTTFERSRFEVPFAPFVGTNHHKQTTVFGAALLYDESSESFLWLFQTFLTAMSGKQPATILTDESDEISKAIRSVFPNSVHRIGLHQICHGASKHVNLVCNHPQFLSDFKRCVYEQKSLASLDLKWKEMLSAYNLEGNTWVKNLYARREMWAPVYCQDSFYADMMSAQSNKGRNSTFKKFRRKLCLPEFIEDYEKCITSLRQNELEEDYKSGRTNTVPFFPDLPMLKAAAEFYTRNLYSDFEEELKKSFTLSCTLLAQDGTISTYKFMPTNCEGEAYAVFNSDDVTVSCSCKMYERTGMLCKHALRVFNLSNVFELPSHYIFKRWTKDAKAGLFCRANDQSSPESAMSRCARISQKIHSVALRCSTSENALQYLESGIDRLLWEVENLSSSTNLNGNDICQSLES